MAAPKKILVLDLGMQSIRLAEFSLTAKGGLKLPRGAKREFLLDPSLDASRPEQTSHALKEILKEWKLRSADLTCILPSHMVFSRVVQLDVPGGAAGKVDAVANFEAQQNIPFPLEEVVWDFAVMGETSTGGVNVVFVAVKADLLESLCQSISSTGLKISSISVAPLALFDSYRNAYPEGFGSSALILDIGSRTTNLVISKEGSFFSRSIPSGGLAVTSAIAKDFQSDLDEAERLKIAHGSVGLAPGFQPPSDPVEANLARVIRQTLLKTQADISRSLSYYRTSLGGSDPDLVLLAGGMASLPYLAEFLNEKLHKEVSFFNPLKEVSSQDLSHSAAASFIAENPNSLGELVGGALGLIPGSRTPIKLLPPSIAKKRSFAKRLPYLLAATAIFLATLAAWYICALNATTATREESGKLASTFTTETSIANKIDSLLAKQLGVEKTAEKLFSVIQLREAYPKILAELCSKIPERFLWMTEIQPVEDDSPRGTAAVTSSDRSVKAIMVKGLYLDNPRQAAVIDDFVTSLQSSTIFSVEEKSKSKIITQRGSPNGEYWAYPFTLRIPLKTPIITPLP